MAVNINVMVYWDVTPCSLVDKYQSSGGSFFFIPQRGIEIYAHVYQITRLHISDLCNFVYDKDSKKCSAVVSERNLELFMVVHNNESGYTLV